MNINGKESLSLLKTCDYDEVHILRIFPEPPAVDQFEATIKMKIRLANEEARRRFE